MQSGGSPNFTATVEAHDVGTGVAFVEFRLDGTLIATVWSAPYTAFLFVRTSGIVEVQVADRAGNIQKLQTTVRRR